MYNNFQKKLSNYSLLFVENEDGIRENLNEVFSLFFRENYSTRDGEEGYVLSYN